MQGALTKSKELWDKPGLHDVRQAAEQLRHWEAVVAQQRPRLPVLGLFTMRRIAGVLNNVVNGEFHKAWGYLCWAFPGIADMVGVDRVLLKTLLSGPLEPLAWCSQRHRKGGAKARGAAPHAVTAAVMTASASGSRR